MELDRLDLAILARLQRDGRATSHEIGAEVGLSPTAVQRRIKRLRADGVIVAETAVVSRQAVGRGLTAIVAVELAQGGQKELIDAFKTRMSARPEVQQCYYTAGEADFVMVVTARDPADYERLSRELFFDQPNIRKFTTTLVMDVVKAGLSLPLS